MKSSLFIIKLKCHYLTIFYCSMVTVCVSNINRHFLSWIVPRKTFKQNSTGSDKTKFRDLSFLTKNFTHLQKKNIKILHLLRFDQNMTNKFLSEPSGFVQLRLSTSGFGSATPRTWDGHFTAVLPSKCKL